MRGVRASLIVALCLPAAAAAAACRGGDEVSGEALAELARGLKAGARPAGAPVCAESGPRRWAWPRAVLAREEACRQPLASGGELQVRIAPNGRVQHVDRVWGAAAAAQGDSLARALGTLAARRGGGELTCRSLGGGGTVSARVWALAPGVAEVMVRQDSAGSVRLEAVAGTYRACHSRPTA